MTRPLYSIRMHASAGEKHISGAEKIVSQERIDKNVADLIARAMGRGCAPDRISIKIENLGSTRLPTLTALDLVTLDEPDETAARQIASHVLRTAGVSEQAVESAMLNLSQGAAPSGGNMRGAMIMDARTGNRLETDLERGVRASRFDWSDEAGKVIDKLLAAIGLTHFRVREALALATKVAHAPGVIAELCWSDEPDYTAGYAASLKTGYVRFPALKRGGDPRGGRVFFVDPVGLDMNALVNYLQIEPVLIVNAGACRRMMNSEEYFKLVKAVE